MVGDKDGQAILDGIKEGQIIFMKLGPFNLMPFVNEYESKSIEQGELKQPIMTKTGLTDQKLRYREKQLINSYVQMPCHVSFIE